MWELGYESHNAYPDLWMKPEFRPEDKIYNSYIVCYEIDILCIHHDPDGVLNKLNVYVSFKAGLVSSPNIYHGTKLKHKPLHNDFWIPSKYVQEVVIIC